jgi:hypothetical protein
MVGGAAIAEGDVLTVAASSPTGVGPGSTDSHPIFGVATDSAAANAAVPIWVRPQF